MTELVGRFRGILVALLLATTYLTGCRQKRADEAPAAAAAVPNVSVQQSWYDTVQRALSHQQMVARLRELAEEAKAENPFFGEAIYEQLSAHRTKLPSTTPPPQVVQLLLQLGERALNLGKERDAIAHFQSALAITTGVPGADAERVRNVLRFWLGMAFMRLAETENCCALNSPESCILPFRVGAIHTVREGAENATKYFQAVLASAPKESVEYRRAQWLMNIAYMTLGEFPSGVPADYVLPPEHFVSAETMEPLKNIAASVKLNTFSCAGGAIVDDFDNDDHLDIMVSNYDPQGQLRYFVNEGKSGFVERTAEANLTGIVGGLNLVQADFDNDGHLDVLVLRGGWWHRFGRIPNSLLRNNGDGTFSDVTIVAGLAEPCYPTQTACWGDFNRDGYLDLYIGNESSMDQPSACQLFQNNGDGTFTDVAHAAHVTNDAYAKSVTCCDFDGDGWADLYVSNLGAANRLYRNNGDGTFTDVAAEMGVTEPIASFPCWFWDYNNDGHLDIAAFAFAAHIEDLNDACTGEVNPSLLPCFYRGTGDGFVRETGILEPESPSAPMGANFGDLDGDGFLDFYLGTGWPPIFEVMPNLFYKNQDGERFVDLSMSSGMASVQKGHAVCFADIDHDGDLDVFQEMGGAFPGDQYFDALYENPGSGNDWVVLQLVGVNSNRSAIGARLKVTVVSNGQSREIYRWVNSGGSFGASPLRQCIGLGKCDMLHSVEIIWPNSTRQVFNNIQKRRLYRILESHKEPIDVSYERLQFPIE